MRIKFNWGTGIFITIIVFVTFFVGFIFFSLTHDVNLVTKDYFPEEIAYESTLQKIKNTQKLTQKISYNKTKKTIEIIFPEAYDYKKVIGQIHFYYISSYRNDKRFRIQPNQFGKQIFALSEFKKGRYSIKIEWSYNEKVYYQEIKIII